MPLPGLGDFARWFMALSGWRRLAAGFVFGALAAGAMQPLLLWPLLFVSFPVLVWLIDGIQAGFKPRVRTGLQALALGWAFGFGYFLASLYWIGAAFLVDAKTYGWMLPIAIAALPAAMALYWGAATGLAVMVWPRGLRRILLLAALLSLSEWLRGRLFTGFPWNTPGYALEAFDGLTQLAAYLGIWGLTFLSLLWASLPALGSDWDHTAIGRRWAPALLLAAVPLWLFGTLRLENAADAAVPGVRVRIVQPNVPQSDKWRSENAAAIFQDLIALSTNGSTAAGRRPPTHVVWPESSVPFLIDEQPEALAAIDRALPDATILLMGSLRRTIREPGSPHQVYNSLFAIDGSGRLRGVYDKWHLVPYGEYLPFAAWLEPLGFRKVVDLPGTFDRGEGARTLAVEGTPAFSPLICYEAIFPGHVLDPKARPAWLLNVTNDGWFGATSGPYQHLAQARFRAIEEGLPMIRAANTGISAVIDAHGRIVHRLPLGSRGRIDSLLPAPIPETFYSRFGDMTFFLMLTLGAATILLPRRAARASAAS